MTLKEFEEFIEYFKENINIFEDDTTKSIWLCNLSTAFVNYTIEEQQRVIELKNNLDSKTLKLK